MPDSKKCLVQDCNCTQYLQPHSEGTKCLTCNHDIVRHIVCKECDCRKYLKPAPKKELLCTRRACGHGIRSHVMTKKQAVAAIPKYISPHKCFVVYMNKYQGWQPCGPYGCAHYVAHAASIQGSGSITCQEGCAVRNSELIEDLQEKNLNNVAVGDIFFKEGDEPHGHSGWVSEIEPIKIKNLSYDRQRICEDTYGEDISGGKFYGKTTNKTTRWLANLNRSDPTRKPEVHDLENEKEGCQIASIKEKKYYSSKEAAMADDFDPCAHCIPGESTK